VLGNQRLKNIYDTKGPLSLSNGFTEEGEEFAGYSFSGNAFTIFKDFFGSENPWS
jgi:DnaJ-class molecular chaperone